MEQNNPTQEPGAAPAPYAAGTGSAPMLPGREELDRMSYRERLALKRADPAAYEQMRRG